MLIYKILRYIKLITYKFVNNFTNEDIITSQDVYGLSSIPSKFSKKVSDKNRYFVIESISDEWLERLRNLQKTVSVSTNVAPMKFAVLDSGMDTNHPFIKPKLRDSINLTDEPNSEDGYGHGTVVTLISLISFGAQNVDLYNVKVLDSNGRGKRKKLIEAIEWCLEKQIDIMNISAGVFRESCQADCDLCMAARKAGERSYRPIILAASGNQGFSKTSCPAKVGLKVVSAVIAVGANDPETGKVAEYSGEANIYAPGTIWIIEKDLQAVHVDQGNFYRKVGKYEEAITSYDKAIEINPKYEGAWNNKGLALSDSGRYEDAIMCYDNALELNSMLDLAWYNKGIALFNLGKYEQSIDCNNKAIEINDKNSKAWHNKALALASLGKYEEAINSYDKALEIDPNTAQIWNNKASALSSLDKHEDAIACYDKALEINSNYAEAWYNKGVALDDLGKYKDAIACYDKALEINSNYARAWHNKGSDLGRIGRYEEAIKCYDEVLQINPNYAEAWYNKGVAFGMLGRHEEEITCYDKALEIDPNHGNALNNKRAALSILGR